MTSLRISGAEQVEFSSSIPGFKKLTALQHLKFSGVREVDLSFCSRVAQLTYLHYNPAQYRHHAMAALLGVFPKLKQLQQLEVPLAPHCQIPSRPAGDYYTAKRCSALVSSSALTKLVLNGSAARTSSWQTPVPCKLTSASSAVLVLIKRLPCAIQGLG